MTSSLDSLTAEQVQQIVALVESLDRSSFDHLQVTLGDLRITLGKGIPPAVAAEPPPAPGKIPAAAPLPSPPSPAAPQPSTTAPASGAQPAVSVVPSTPAAEPAGPAEDGGTVAVVAPLLGTFYARPQPEAPPFVQVGDLVAPDTSMALVEVMKLFTPVVAGVRGVVEEICVQDGQMVEFQQVLFRVRPSDADRVSEPAESSAP